MSWSFSKNHKFPHASPIASNFQKPGSLRPWERSILAWDNLCLETSVTRLHVNAALTASYSLYPEDEIEMHGYMKLYVLIVLSTPWTQNRPSFILVSRCVVKWIKRIFPEFLLTVFSHLQKTRELKLLFNPKEKVWVNYFLMKNTNLHKACKNLLNVFTKGRFQK